MAIAVKSVVPFSATTDITGSWSVTASTSIASGDALILVIGYNASASADLAYTSGITDNAGNSWSLVTRTQPDTTLARNPRLEMWYAPVTTVTANFQIAIGGIGGKTVSARAAHVIVVSGLAASPLDSPTVKATRGTALNATGTLTASTSLASTVADSIVIAATIVNNNVTSLTQETGWTAAARSKVAGAQNQNETDSFYKIVAATGTFAFSASLSAAGTDRPYAALMAVFKAPVGQISATATMSMTANATLRALGALAGRGTASMTANATLKGFGALAGRGTASMTANATLRALGALRAAPSMVFTSSAMLDATTATGSAAIAQIQAQTLLGGGWDPLLFRRMLLEKKRKLMRAAAVIANEAEDTPLEKQADRLEQRIEARDLPETRAAMRRALQSLESMDRQLQALRSKVEVIQDDEDEDSLLVMVA